MVPPEGDVDPSDVIRATFAPMPRGQPLPGAMPGLATPQPERRAPSEAGPSGPEAEDWAEGDESFMSSF